MIRFNRNLCRVEDLMNGCFLLQTLTETTPLFTFILGHVVGKLDNFVFRCVDHLFQVLFVTGCGPSCPGPPSMPPCRSTTSDVNIGRGIGRGRIQVKTRSRTSTFVYPTRC